MSNSSTFILGAGVTGLAAAYASGLPTLEAQPNPGGICSSYYVRPNTPERLPHPPADEQAYRFEIGGGHWIFGGDALILNFLQRLTPLKTYQRRSSVYFHQENQYVPYPIQNFLHYFAPQTITQALSEMASPKQTIITMKDWLEQSFGPTLCQTFFYPFHELYTAGLYHTIAPQDAYKSPINLATVIRGALENNPPVGYNTTFVYPKLGLDQLARSLSRHCNILYNKKVIEISLDHKILTLADGTCLNYDRLLATLPLNQLLQLTKLDQALPPDPHTSVLVLNIGAKKGPHCPPDHWLYNPDAQSGFHRVGFYSNIDAQFLPQAYRENQQHISLYIERAYLGSQKPSPEAIQEYSQAVVNELQAWGYIEDIEVLDPTWIDVAYTWTLPQSNWRNQAIQQLEEHDIYPIGRYARWQFQGIADSIQDGFFSGMSFKNF